MAIRRSGEVLLLARAAGPIQRAGATGNVERDAEAFNVGPQVEKLIKSDELLSLPECNDQQDAADDHNGCAFCHRADSGVLPPQNATEQTSRTGKRTASFIAIIVTVLLLLGMAAWLVVYAINLHDTVKHPSFTTEMKQGSKFEQVNIVMCATDINSVDDISVDMYWPVNQGNKTDVMQNGWVIAQCDWTSFSTLSGKNGEVTGGSALMNCYNNNTQLAPLTIEHVEITIKDESGKGQANDTRWCVRVQAPPYWCTHPMDILFVELRMKPMPVRYSILQRPFLGLKLMDDEGWDATKKSFHLFDGRFPWANTVPGTVGLLGWNWVHNAVAVSSWMRDDPGVRTKQSMSWNADATFATPYSAQEINSSYAQMDVTITLSSNLTTHFKPIYKEQPSMASAVITQLGSMSAMYRTLAGFFWGPAAEVYLSRGGAFIYNFVMYVRQKLV